MKPSFPPSRRSRFSAWARTAGALALIALTSATLALADRDRVKGVTNFGRVTDTILRGGDVTSTGLENLHAMGVRTVIDLAGDDEKEGRTCRRLGMTFHSFPMDADERPDDATVDRILQILRNAEEPVYLHCSAGKHRTGAIAALYRIRVQGWAPEKAWAEQQSYGFGPAKGHRELYEYVYGSLPASSKSKHRGKR
jgi:protein tyrosine/serine phosphatase